MNFLSYTRHSLCNFANYQIRKNGINLYSSSPTTSPSNYCMEMVRQYDYENFLSLLLLPKDIRTSAFAIRAFNIEIAKIQDTISESRIGQMRLKFWEETVEKLYKNDVPKHPVAVQLHRVVKNCKLSKIYLKRLISVRENYLLSNTFMNIEAMEQYAENSVSPVFYLILETAGIESVHADHAASHLGKAQGIVNLIRSTTHNIQHRIVTLPQNILLENNVSQEKILRGIDSDDLGNVVFTVASRAKQHLDKARSLSSQVPKAASTIFLPAVAVDSYLERLRKANFRVFDGTLQCRNGALPLLLFWKKLQSKY